MPDRSDANVGPRRDIPSLDGLRALSILLVIGAHASKGPGLPRGLVLPHRFAELGVRVFFVISGYLITSLLVKEIAATGTLSLKRFYFRRTLRIFPPYYAYLAVCALCVATGWLVAPSHVRWLPAVTYTSNFVSTNWWVTGHSWTLSAEEQFYLYWPLTILLLGRRRALYGAAAILLLSPLARVAIFLTTHDAITASLWSFDFMAAGSALALAAPLLDANDAWRRVMRAPAVVALAAALLLALFYRSVAESTRWVFAFDIVAARAIEAIGLAVLIAWCVENHETWLGRALNARPVRLIGVLSYSLYLWQEIFLRPDGPLTGAVALGAVFGAAALAYLLVERPALLLRQRFERSRAARRGAQASALASAAGVASFAHEQRAVAPQVQEQ